MKIIITEEQLKKIKSTDPIDQKFQADILKDFEEKHNYTIYSSTYQNPQIYI